MGTTTTPNLGLIKPDLQESIRLKGPMPGWAAQNALNCDAIDAVFHSSATDPWGGFTWTAETTNPTLGTGGFVEARYLRLWKKMVFVYFRINAGTTGFNPGEGTYRLNLPFAVSTALDEIAAGLEMPVGRAYLRDNSSVIDSEIASVSYAPDTNNLFLRVEGGSWSHTAPFDIAQSDRVSGYFMFPTDTLP